jgi:hypothetical protein
LKLTLQTLAATALLVLAADVCLAASSGAGRVSKQLKDVVRLTHPQASKGRQLNRAPRNNAVHTAPDAQKAGIAAVPVPTRNTSIVSATAAVPGPITAPASVSNLRTPVFHVTPPSPPPAAVHDAVVSGSGFKAHTSTLVALGGSATGEKGKGTAVISGTSVQLKKTH